jgi:hypothetical protein
MAEYGADPAMQTVVEETDAMVEEALVRTLHPRA